MSSGERPMGAAKGKQADTEALCQTPPPPVPHGPPQTGGAGRAARTLRPPTERSVDCPALVAWKARAHPPHPPPLLQIVLTKHMDVDDIKTQLNAKMPDGMPILDVEEFPLYHMTGKLRESVAEVVSEHELLVQVCDRVTWDGGSLVRSCRR